jgi:hypothetical protein
MPFGITAAPVQTSTKDSLSGGMHACAGAGCVGKPCVCCLHVWPVCSHAIVSSAVGPEYYVGITSFVDKTQLEPGCSVLLHNKVRLDTHGNAAAGCTRSVSRSHLHRRVGPLGVRDAAATAGCKCRILIVEACRACNFQWLGAAAGCALLLLPLMLWLVLLLPWMLLAAGDVSCGYPAGRDRPHGVCHEGEGAMLDFMCCTVAGGGHRADWPHTTP